MLCIDETEIVLTTEFHESDHRHFGSIRLNMEHRFSAEYLADTHSIETAYKTTFMEGLEAMGQAQLVQPHVSL